MKISSFSLIVFLFLITVKLSGQEQSTVYGSIVDSTGYSIGFANVTLPGTKYGTTADRFGQYSLNIPSGKNTLIITCIGYENQKLDVVTESGKKSRYDIVLKMTYQNLEEVKVSSRTEQIGTVQRIDTKILNNMPNVSGGIENVIKQLPGVASNNELSSQYSVRGGSFDENLVYVNNIEIYKPILIRSGQQEGLSFVNPDLVGSLKFSAGGFDATYGDKMSSVLDINYKRPEENQGAASASMLGGSVYYEGISKNKKFRHLTGLRYKTSQYLLASMDTKGEYKPSYVDAQTYLTYDLLPKLELSFLGNFGQNRFDFVPTDRETEFGTFEQQQKLTVYYEGSEHDLFQNAMGAFTFNYHSGDTYSLKLIGAAYATSESETFDILGQYRISDVNIGSQKQNDSSQTIGVGSFLNHARDYLNSSILSVSHVGNYNFEHNKVKWGITLQQESITDHLNEWEMVDSTSHVLPYSPSSIILPNASHSNNDLKSHRMMGYVQNTLELTPGNDKIFITTGLRSHYWSINKQTIWNPRFSISYKPNWKQNLLLYFAVGGYSQPPFYKELRKPDGDLNLHLKAQTSIHYVLGSDYIFYALSRPFKMTTELYYKSFDNLDPYHVDDVRITYAGGNIAKGYAQGIDFKVNGEFVKGTESWISISLLQTQEAIKSNYLVDGTDTFAKAGYYSRPTDQLFNLSLYFQYYLPRYPSYKVHLSLHYGSRLPVTIPLSHIWNDVDKIIPPYSRVDLGFSKLIKGQDDQSGNRFVNYFKEIWIGAEIFNVLGINNTISYLWVKSVSNQDNIPGYFAVPNYLTSRRLNVKITVSF
jgi:hypothetical protein